MACEEQRKNNKKEYNEFLLKLNELRGFDEVGSIKALAHRKLLSFMNYCESKDIDYFSELPISKKINQYVFGIVEDSEKYDAEATEVIEDSATKMQSSILIKLMTGIKTKIKLDRIYNKYFLLYSELSEWTFESVYSKAYKDYYSAQINNISDDELCHMLNRDKELAIKLDMEEKFNEIVSRIENCKTNVYKIK